jgi:uncharacterized membrane protein
MSKRRRRNQKVSKREQELARRQDRMDQMRKLIIPAVLIVIVAFAVVIALGYEGSDGPEPTDSVYVNDSNQIEIDETEVTSSARYYSYDAGSKEVRFFAVRGTDGKVRIALDACDVCYSAKKGYRQAGTNMKCNNCGNEYATDGIGTENIQGGCWPSFVPMSEEAGKILVATKGLRDKKFMF